MIKIKKSRFRRIISKIYINLEKFYFKIQTLKNESIIIKNKKRGVFAVEIQSNMGIGANLIWALEVMAYCNEKDLVPQIKFKYPGSRDFNDYFKDFFSIPIPKTTNKPVGYAKMRSFKDLNLNFVWDYNSKLNLELADKLIKKYLKISDVILDEVLEFEEKKFKNKKILGVHYRGTDKKSEAPSIKFEDVLKNINFYIEKFPETDLVFISSDDANFIDYMSNSQVKRPLEFNNDSFRSTNGLAIHNSGQNLYLINKDAIINCLLLSKCDALMKTASILSAWSKLFNPKIPLIILTKPYKKIQFFPEKDFKNVLFEPL